MRILFILFILTLSISLQAQHDEIHTSFKLGSITNERVAQETDFNFTAIALKSNRIKDFSEIGFILDNDTIYFNNEIHTDETSPYFYSTLINFDKVQTAIELYLGENVNDLEVVLINGSEKGTASSQRNSSDDHNDDCELNDVVLQSDWRAGLPAPSYTRSYTDAAHLIVHHAAGSNNISNYKQAVRNIYILHTEENGWADIGYNYLVDPNGVIYAGRDPAIGAQDRVMGAHFCGRNSGTMGICLVGNYETAEPSVKMLESLVSILSWKAFKEELNVMESSSHPLNSNLGVIAGHRDGCNTLCPGENVYKRLPTIRESVEAQLMICRGEEEDPVIDLELDSVLSKRIYPNPVQGDLSFSLELTKERQENLRYILIFDQTGKKIKWEHLYFTENKVEVTLPSNIDNGIYLFYTYYKNGIKDVQKFKVQ